MEKDKKPPRIDCYLIGDCASEGPLKALMSKVKEEVPSVVVEFHRLSPEQAERLGITGSPTVLVNGRDVSPQQGQTGGT